MQSLREAFGDTREQLELILTFLDERAFADILLLAAGLYLIYRTFRFSGSRRILSGVLFLAVIFILSRFFGLRAVPFLFITFRDLFILLLIVLFQPEIRRMLERAMAFRGFRLEKEGAFFSDQLSRTIFDLARARTGAILILPGRESVEAFLNGGIEAGAMYSDALLRSIFDEHSPGHDGAVLIENERIKRFALRLPLARENTILKNLGTRHHAGMGLSERTDALVIVVSEERGTVTTFQSGLMESVREQSELVTKIQNFAYRSQQPAGERLRELLQTAPAMAASLLLAILLWGGIILSEGRIRQTEVKVPIESVGRPPGLMIADMSHHTVILRLSGTKQKLNQATPENIRLRLNLRDAAPGRLTYSIRSRNLELPPGVEMIAADPPELRFSVVAINESEARIRPNLAGKLPAGLSLESVQVDPAQVAVYLVSDNADRKNLSIPTERIDLKNITESTEVAVRLLPPAVMRPVEKRWPQIKVRLTVSQPSLPAEESGDLPEPSLDADN
ncbi:MAG: DNA integrity scanning protein DisA nucleotide-binding domain protein [Spirochaetales bacterium]|nr:DNA integrity scanning protein DisA nucleotide-binding domain protein [Spirochaetales bacterium]